MKGSLSDIEAFMRSSIKSVNGGGRMELRSGAVRAVLLGPWDDFQSWGVGPAKVYSVPHGLGATPRWAVATASCGTSTVGPSDPVSASILGMNASAVDVYCRFVSGGSANLPGVFVYVLAAIW